MSEFSDFWSVVDAELAETPSRPVVEVVPARCTDRFTGYEVRLTGLGGFRLFGYLSVPTGPGPFPALLETPRHGSVNHAPHYNDRLRYVVFTAMHRGQRRADSPFAAEYPGLFTLGIDSARTYVYRSIVADCLRAAEFLAARPEVDPARMALSGDDLALVTAARRPVFQAVRVTSPLLHDVLQRRKGTTEYPLEEINDYLRRHPGHESRLAATLAMFDPIGHVPAARTLLVLPSGPEVWRRELIEALGPVLDTYSRCDEDAVDAWELDRWLAERLGVAALSRFVEGVP